jgi:hypothetical protein
LSKNKLILVGLLVILMGSSLAVVTRSIPPPGIASDGHNADAVLGTGSVIETGMSFEAELFATVAQFHADLANNAVPSQTCLTCHSDIAQRETIQRKMPNEDGSITTTEETNHHLIHSTKAFLNFGEACTFCHLEFDTAVEDNQVTIAGYVDKTTCAGCHSRFAPRNLMDVAYYEDNGCPGCHDGAWESNHTGSPNFAPYMLIDEIDLSERGCLVCHGDNKLQMPESLQDLFWADR